MKDRSQRTEVEQQLHYETERNPITISIHDEVVAKQYAFAKAISLDSILAFEYLIRRHHRVPSKQENFEPVLVKIDGKVTRH